MKRDASVFLQHILESIARIEEFTEGMSKEDFVASVKTQDAVIRRLEIIGEASKNLPNSFREKHPEIEWGDMIRTRDKLSHGYFGVDLKLAWDILKNDLPALKEKIGKILGEMRKDE